MKGPDAFERSLKETMESYELPYNSADWTEMERQLDKKEGGGWKSSTGLLALLLGGGIAMSTAIYFLVSPAGDAQDNGSAQIAMVSPATQVPEAAPTTLQESAIGQEINTELASTGNSATTSAIVPVARKSATLVPSARQVVVAPPINENGPTGSEVAVRASVTQGCPGTAVEFAASNLPSEGTFLWNFGDGSFSRDPQPKHTFNKAGRFEVMLSHSASGGGMVPEPVSNVIVIHETPEALFNSLPQEYDHTVPSVHFENRSLGGQSYLWEFGDGATSSIAHPNHVYKKRGNYTVALTVTNSGGCTDRMERTLKVSNDYNLLAASTFSPNGDGVEDSFIPEALKSLGVRFHMSVHDPANGRLIYETSDAQRPWNGRIGGRGDACATQDYVWMVEMKDGDKLGGTYTGTVSLLR